MSGTLSSRSYIYLVHGDDQVACLEFVDALKGKMRSLAGGEYNITSLDGAGVAVEELRAICDAAPFLADRRMVIVKGLLARLLHGSHGGRRARGAQDRLSELDQLFSYVSQLPPWTHLVLVEPLLEDEGLVRARLPADRLVVRRFQLPDRHGMTAWVQRRVRQHGGKIDPPAAALLVSIASEDPVLLEREIGKLVAYAPDRPIRREDVLALASPGEVQVFALLDALAEGRTGNALDALRALLQQGEKPEALVGQVAAMLHRLLQVLELTPAGRLSQEQATEHGLNPRAVARLSQQARRWSVERLEAALRELLECDYRSKTGAMDPETALELSLAELGTRTQ